MPAVDVAGGSVSREPVVTATPALAEFADEPADAYSSPPELSVYLQPARVGYGEKRKGAGGLLP